MKRPLLCLSCGRTFSRVNGEELCDKCLQAERERLAALAKELKDDEL